VFLSIVLIAWGGGVVLSFMNGTRRVACVSLLLGLAALVLSLIGITGYFSLAGAMALLAATLWIVSEVGRRNTTRHIMVQAICCGVAALTSLGFVLNTLFTHHTPPLAPSESNVQAKQEYYDWWFLEELGRLRGIIALLLLIAFLLLAFRLWGRLRARDRRLHNPYE
jgi:hypothetical protein